MRLFEKPEDFQVDEVPLYAPTGEGSHTFVRIEKRNRTTPEVAQDLARAAGVKARDVGYAGLKDKLAVTTQWFSVPGLAPEAALALELSDARVLEAEAHPHKLRTGQLRANRFRILARDAERQGDAAEARVQELVARGMPNRFGPQRFGRRGDNADLGRRLLAGELNMRDRRRARLFVSALQAEVFNIVLERRELPLDAVEVGDVARVQASGGLFLVEDAKAENKRAQRFEISPTGPIFGNRVIEPASPVAERERAVLTECGIDIDSVSPPPGVRLRGARRPLRVLPEEVRIEREGPDLVVQFMLPPGSYASVFLQEVLGDTSD